MDLLTIVIKRLLLLIISFLATLTLLLLFYPEFIDLSFLILAAGLYVFLRDMARKIEFLCPNCGRLFRATIVQQFFSPHQTYYKLLRCPKCSEVSWCIAKYYDGAELDAKIRRIEERKNIYKIALHPARIHCIILLHIPDSLESDC